MIRHPGLKAWREPSSNISVRASARSLAYATVHHQWPRLYLSQADRQARRQAGSGHQLSITQPKLAGCSQRSEANIKQRSFHFQWAIMQQHLDERPCETFFLPPPPPSQSGAWLHQHRPSTPLGWMERAFLLVFLTRSQEQGISPTRYFSPFLIC